MKVWVVCDVYECEYDFSTHLTEQGALLEVCQRILEWMGIYFGEDSDEDWAERVDGMVEADHPFGANFDVENWRSLDTTKLWAFYDFIQEFTWDANDFDITIRSTEVQP